MSSPPLSVPALGAVTCAIPAGHGQYGDVAIEDRSNYAALVQADIGGLLRVERRADDQSELTDADDTRTYRRGRNGRKGRRKSERKHVEIECE